MTSPSSRVGAEQGCDAHGYHSPSPTYLVVHHCLPLEWQAAWRPAHAPANGPVWLPVSVTLCPTGHANVHYLIARILEAWAKHHDLGRAEEVAVGGLRAVGLVVGRAELRLARRAFDLWTGHGGDLQVLVDEGLWSEL